MLFSCKMSSSEIWQEIMHIIGTAGTGRRMTMEICCKMSISEIWQEIIHIIGTAGTGISMTLHDNHDEEN
jgi:hypothetical protein